MNSVMMGALFGAGGAAAYLSPEARGTLGHVIGIPSWSHYQGGAHGGQGGGKELEHLYRMVEQLSRDIHRKQGGVTIVSGSNGAGATTWVVFYSATAAAVYLAYLRIFRGWKFTDMMYVTKASLNQSINQVSEGLEGLGSRLGNVKAFLQQQVQALSRKQDAAMAAQEELKGQVGEVGVEVDATRMEVSEVHAAVRDLESSLDDISAHQRYATDGIFILCKVVGELMSGSGNQRMSSLVELEKYVRRPISLGGRSVPGLEGLLSDSPAPTSGADAAGGISGTNGGLPAPPMGGRTLRLSASDASSGIAQRAAIAAAAMSGSGTASRSFSTPSSAPPLGHATSLPIARLSGRLRAQRGANGEGAAGAGIGQLDRRVLAGTGHD